MFKFCVRAGVITLMLSGSVLDSAAAQTSCEASVTTRLVDRKAVDDQEFKDVKAIYTAPEGCKITNWQISVANQFGDSSYATEFIAPSTVRVTYTLKSHKELFRGHARVGTEIPGKGVCDAPTVEAAEPWRGWVSDHQKFPT